MRSTKLLNDKHLLYTIFNLVGAKKDQQIRFHILPVTRVTGYICVNQTLCSADAYDLKNRQIDYQSVTNGENVQITATIITINTSISISLTNAQGMR